jgi:hypothetical protein
MAHLPFMPAKGSMQVYRAGNPKKSPLWQCAPRRKKEISFRQGSKANPYRVRQVRKILANYKLL